MVEGIRFVNLMNNEVASLMNDGYVLSEPESTKGRGMGMCFIKSSSLCFHFGEAKTSLVPLAQTSLREQLHSCAARTSLREHRVSLLSS